MCGLPISYHFHTCDVCMRACTSSVIVLMPVVFRSRYLLPQHHASPPAVSAHVRPPRCRIETKRWSVITARGAVTCVWLSVPSWPSLFHPQQYALPSPVRAHVLPPPALICVNAARISPL